MFLGVIDGDMEVVPQHMLPGEPQGGGHPTVIVNPFADVNLLQQSPNSKTSLISSGNPASSLNSSPGLGGMIPSRASERFSSLRAKSNKLNAKLNQVRPHNAVHCRTRLAVERA